MANRYVKKSSASLIMRAVQHLPSLGMALTKNPGATYWQDVEKGDPAWCTSIPCWWEWKLVQPLRKTVWRLL